MELLVILIVPLIALLIGGWSMLASRPADVAEERARVEQHIVWLEQRMADARAGNWDEQMVDNLQMKLARAHRERALLNAA